MLQISIRFIFHFLFLFLLIFSTVRTGHAQEWTSSRVYGPFACWATFDLTPMDPDLRELAETYEELKKRLKLPPLEEWIELYVFADDSEWRDFLQTEYPQIPYRRALFIKKKKSRGQLFLYLSSSFANDLRHESTHAFMHAVLPEVPLWLDEGLAEYFEVASAPEFAQTKSLPLRSFFNAEEHDPRRTASEWFTVVLERAEGGEISSIQELETLETMESMTPLDYADSWAWVNFLLNGPDEVRDILPLYVADLAKRKTLPIYPIVPVSRRLEKIYPFPKKELAKFLKKLR